MKKWFASLQARVLALVAAVVVCGWLGAVLLASGRVEHEIDELLDAHLAQAAALLIARESNAGDGDDDDLADDAPELHRYAPRVAFQVWHGSLLALRSANAPRQPMGQHKAGFAPARIDGQPWRVFAARGGERDILVYVGESVDARDDIVKAIRLGMATPPLIALPLLLLLAGWAVQRGLSPLRALAGHLQARSPEALTPVTLADPPRELQAVTGALNALFERISSLLASERRFTADAAHELRTPIAAIAAQAQVALAATDDAERRHALQGTLLGCERATRLVEQMLTLARLEHQADAARHTVDLAALARSVLADLLPAAGARRQTVELDAPDHCSVQADEALLRVLLRNLVDNALRHSPPAASVHLTLETNGGQWRLLIDDSGPGIDDGQQRRLGERFVRLPGTEASGSGLGWSIVRRIAGVLRLQVDTGRSPLLGGLRVTVQAAR